MKKTIFLAVLALAACTKTEQYASVTFKSTFSHEGEITKATATALAAEVNDFMLTPDTFDLTLTRNGGAEYETATGETISLPIDTYQVTARYEGSPRSVEGYPELSYYFYPVFVIDQSVEIHSYTKTISLEVGFDAFCLIVDCKEIADWGYMYNGSRVSFDAYNRNGYELAFFSGNWEDTLTIWLEAPSDTDYTDTEFNISRSDVDNGKWYNLSPSAATIGSGTFDFSLSTFSQGTI